MSIIGIDRGVEYRMLVLARGVFEEVFTSPILSSIRDATPGGQALRSTIQRIWARFQPTFSKEILHYLRSSHAVI